MGNNTLWANNVYNTYAFPFWVDGFFLVALINDTGKLISSHYHVPIMYIENNAHEQRHTNPKGLLFRNQCLVSFDRVLIVNVG